MLALIPQRRQVTLLTKRQNNFQQQFKQTGQVTIHGGLPLFFCFRQSSSSPSPASYRSRAFASSFKMAM